MTSPIIKTSNCPCCLKQNTQNEAYRYNYGKGNDSLSSMLKVNELLPATVINCRHCKAGYAWPIPSERFLAKYYQTSFDRVRAFSIAAKSRVDLLEKNNVLKAIGLEGEICEIGSGAGCFLLDLKSRKYNELTSIEPSLSTALYQKQQGLRVINEMLGNTPPTNDTFDLVAMFHVLEHARSGHDTINALMRMIKPGGYLFLEVPNSTSEFMIKAPNYWPHLLFFNRNSLVHLAALASLELIFCDTAGEPLNQRKGRWEKRRNKTKVKNQKLKTQNYNLGDRPPERSGTLEYWQLDKYGGDRVFLRAIFRKPL